MVNWIWLFFIVVGFLVAAINGECESVTQAAFDGAKNGVTVCFGLISVLVFWMGMMRIAEDAGILTKLAKITCSPRFAFFFQVFLRIIQQLAISCRT